MGIEICLMMLWEIVADVIAIFRLDTHVLTNIWRYQADETLRNCKTRSLKWTLYKTIYPCVV